LILQIRSNLLLYNFLLVATPLLPQRRLLATLMLVSDRCLVTLGLALNRNPTRCDRFDLLLSRHLLLKASLTSWHDRN
jgi:hypothetical protein